MAESPTGSQMSISTGWGYLGVVRKGAPWAADAGPLGRIWNIFLEFLSVCLHDRGWVKLVTPKRNTGGGNAFRPTHHLHSRK